MLRRAVDVHGGLVDGIKHVCVLDVLVVVSGEGLGDCTLHRVRRRYGGSRVVVYVGGGLGPVRQD